ncbi:TPM domain-containing protein [Salinibacterium sp. NYA9b]
MVPHALPFLVATDTAELLRGTTIAVATVVVLVLAIGVIAFIVLFRRGGDRGIRGTSSQSALESRAASLLVTLDDRVREADYELGFAVAQFGAAASRDFASALAEARGQLTEAFRLGQQRDDVSATADHVRRRITLQMTALCEQALAKLDRFDTAFAERRRSEVGAAETEQQLRARLTAVRLRQTTAQDTVAELATTYVESAVKAARHHLDTASTTLDESETALDAAAPGISPTGVNAVTDTLRAAATALHRADRAVSAAESAVNELAQADAAVTRMRADSASDLLEARVARETAPDPTSGARIVTAIAANERALEQTAPASGVLHDPFEQLALLGDAAAELDTALATARNQQQRFEHARAAYQGTLVAARSQISVVHELVGRSGASARARTRLAEAERQLMIAEAETDPVEALDAIRRSVTHARDADALARY